MISPGQLDRQISIQSKTVTIDSGGGHSVAWTDFAVIWAKKIDKGGREFNAARNVIAETETIWKARYRADVTSAHRIKYGSLVYDILYVGEVGRRSELAIESKLIGADTNSTANNLTDFNGNQLTDFDGNKLTDFAATPTTNAQADFAGNQLTDFEGNRITTF